jgi:hypothetical protein
MIQESFSGHQGRIDLDGWADWRWSRLIVLIMWRTRHVAVFEEVTDSSDSSYLCCRTLYRPLHPNPFYRLPSLSGDQEAHLKENYSSSSNIHVHWSTSR